MTPAVRCWDPVLLPEEVALVEDYLAAGKADLSEPANVYALLLASGAAYVGVSKDARRRLGEHTRSARKTLVSPDVAVEITDAPNEVFLAIHGEPDLVALVVCPSRRHALLYEALLTDRLGQDGVHVFGAGWDQSMFRWTRNESKGAKLDGPGALVALVAAEGA